MAEVAHRCRVDALLAEARADLDRVQPGDLASEMAAGALVIDTRPVEQRDRDGALHGAVVIDRNILEWRLDPTSPHSIPEASNPDRRVIVVCNEVFSSSLAAATLRHLGLTRATDLAGGYQGWRHLVPAPRQAPNDDGSSCSRARDADQPLNWLDRQQPEGLDAVGPVIDFAEPALTGAVPNGTWNPTRHEWDRRPRGRLEPLGI